MLMTYCIVAALLIFEDLSLFVSLSCCEYIWLGLS